MTAWTEIGQHDCMDRNRSANITEQHSFVLDTVGEGERDAHPDLHHHWGWKYPGVEGRRKR